MDDLRCDGCGAREQVPLPEAGWWICTWCNLRSHADRTPMPPIVPGPAGAVPGRVIDRHTMRGLAAGAAARFESDVSASREGLESDGVQATGRLDALQLAPPSAITFAMIARSDDARAEPLVRWARATGFAEVVVVQDAERAVPIEGASVIAHPLEGHFGRQRDRAMRAAETDWLLFLDTDETLDDRLAERLAPLSRLADEGGLDVVALPRANLVDGVLCDRWPDPQSRLVRTHLRYRNRVHEVPDVDDDRKILTVLPGGRHPDAVPAIRHHMSRAHVVARTAAYDALGQDADRAADEAALLTPYDPR